MSARIAPIIIEREVSKAFEEKYNIDQLKNKGRYLRLKSFAPMGVQFSGCWLINRQEVYRWLAVERVEKLISESKEIAGGYENQKMQHR